MRVHSLHVYPLKSAAGVEVAEAEAGPEGLAGDRRWMLVDASGAFVSQRGYPRLSQVRAELRGEDGLWAALPSGEAFEARRSEASARVAVQLWGEQLTALAPSPEADAALSRWLERSVRLVAFAEDVVRPCDPRYAAPGDRVAFADGFPVLVTTTASLGAVQEACDRPVEMARFRPNLVVEGSEPFAEDSWRRIRVGGLELRLVKPCTRCAMVNVDPATGQTSREPTRTLSQMRRVGGRVLFGQNAVFDSFGPVRRGDSVEVLEWAER